MNLMIPGAPFAKQSFRFAQVGNFIRKYQPKKIVEGERTIKFLIINQLPRNFKPFAGPVIVKSITYCFPPLKNFTKAKMKHLQDGNIIFKTTKPDLSDNLNKGLFDAMEGIVYLNDSQICEIQSIKKIYSMKPRIEISIAEMPAEKNKI